MKKKNTQIAQQEHIDRTRSEDLARTLESSSSPLVHYEVAQSRQNVIKIYNFLSTYEDDPALEVS